MSIWNSPPTEYQKAAIERISKSLGVDDYIKDPPHSMNQARGMLYRLLKRLEEKEGKEYTNHATGRKAPSLKVPPAKIKPTKVEPIELDKPMIVVTLIRWAIKDKFSGRILGLPEQTGSIFNPMTFNDRENARLMKHSFYEAVGLQTQVIKVLVKIEEIYSRG
jgi:hypothetical protein